MSSYSFLSIQLRKERGYAVDPDPPQPEVKKASKQGVTKSFARQSRRGYTDLSSTEKVEAAFMEWVEYLCKLGYKRNSLETGSCGTAPLQSPSNTRLTPSLTCCRGAASAVAPAIAPGT